MKNLFDKLSLDETEVESKPMPEKTEGRRRRRRKLSKKEIFVNNMKEFGGKAADVCADLWDKTKVGTTALVKKIMQLDKRILTAGAAALAILICVPIAFAVFGGNDEKTSAEIPEASASLAESDVLPSADVTVSPLSALATQEVISPNVILNTAEPTIEEIDLKPGVSHVSVIELQEALMDLGYMDPDEPTEYYGPMTTNAVKLFQKKNELEADGVAGDITLNLLYSGTAKEYVAALGDTGTDIRELQTRLYELGYIENKAEADGVFGEGTEAAVKEFQKKNGLVQDGKLGTNTKEMLYSEEAKADSYALGDKSDTIKKYQTKLQKLGYLTTKPDGTYGSDTVAAVKRFQEANGLISDGYLGPQTRDLLMSNEAMASSLKLGDSGDQVTSIQKRLRTLGYLKSSATGYFGSDTEAAVKAFQKKNKLTQDGKVGAATLNKLNSSNAVKADGTTSSSKNKSGIDKLIAAAESKLGKPYVLGAKGPNSFDCSGLAYWCINQAGIKQGYMTSRTWRTCTKYPRIKSIDSVRRGDIIIYKMSESKGHVGIAISSSMMIDASSSNGKVVKRSFKTNYWRKTFYCAYRIF